MPKKKLSRAAKQAVRDRILAFIIIEVARATKEARSVNQRQINGLLKQRWKTKKLPDSTMHVYVNQLAGNARNRRGRVWLDIDGQSVGLADPDTILTDSNSIKALLVAFRAVDDDDCINVSRWCQMCNHRYRFSPESCRRYISDYIRCGYAVETGNNKTLQLELQTINADMFYLRQAANAKLKGRPRQTLTPAPRP